MRPRYYHATVETIYGPVNLPVRVYPGESARDVALASWDDDELLTDATGRAYVSAAPISGPEYRQLASY